jgi:2-desacetyl-2-hydroxyethyl bacteriochlorophyllide A dehydrogenase
MKALVWKGPHDLKVEDVAKPTIASNEALVKVIYNGICGTDMTIRKGGHPRAKPPLIVGHETIGRIVEMKTRHRKLRLGDRVALRPVIICGTCFACRSGQSHACRDLRLPGIDFDGGCAEYFKVPLSILHRIPQKAKDEEVALVEPLAVAIHAISRVKHPTKKSSILIQGAGPIGVLIGLMLHHQGCRRVTISDISQFRLGIAKRIGLLTLEASDPGFTFNARALAPEGFDILFEASGSKLSALKLTDLLRVQGTAVMIGVHSEPAPMNLTQVAFKELTLIGSRVYTEQDFEKAIRLASTNRLGLGRLITHTIGLNDSPTGFDAMADANSSLKVLIKCS